MAVTFYTVDVGHGLCQVIRFGQRAILIDGGGRIGKRITEDFLKRYIKVIVAYVATHNDADHVGAAPELLDHYSSSSTLHSIWISLDRSAKRPNQTDEDVITLLGYARQRQKAESVGHVHLLQVSDLKPNVPLIVHREAAEHAELQLLFPRLLDITSSIIRGQPDPVATNQASAILRLVVGNPKNRASVLITGDANCQSFQIAHENYHFDLSARVLSIPHHGGEIPAPPGSSNWDTIVGWVAPEIAMVSSGFSNVPKPTTTKRATFDPLRKPGITTCCTQLTKHCHAKFGSLYPGVMPTLNYSYPQMSGHKDYPNAIGCMGTIAVKIGPSGNVHLINRNQHQAAVDKSVAPNPGCPHCR